VFATVSLFHPSLIFADMARSLPLEQSPVRCSTQVGYNGNNYSRKMFYMAIEVNLTSILLVILIHSNSWIILLL